MTQKRKKIQAKIVKHTKISSNVFDMWIESKDTAEFAKPGQFVGLFCSQGSRLLPRPISICEINEEKTQLRLVYRVVGKGTDEFSKLAEGQSIEVLGPLGNGFEPKDKKISVLVGGGIGIPPLLELCKHIDGEKHIFLGYRDETFLTEDFEQYGKVYVATEDGSTGHKGNVIELIKEKGLNIDQLYTCGPNGMLKALKIYVEENNIESQFSLEEKMACGIGACLACTCKTDEGMSKKRICKDGPVFDVKEVVL